MILVFGVFAGLAAGLLRALFLRTSYQVPDIRWGWLVLAAFFPQYFAFVLPASRVFVPDSWIPVVLILTQALLLVWVAANVRLPSFWLLGAGLTLNFLVIVLNGGFMPIRPELIAQLWPHLPAGAWQIGERFGVGKDIVLPIAQTRLWFLSDAFSLPEWIGYPLAFSIGDVIVALGAFWILWSAGARRNPKSEVLYEHENA